MFKGLALRFGLPMLLVLGIATVLAVPYVDRILTNWFRADIEMRAKVIMRSFEEGLAPLLARRAGPQVERYLSRVTADERLLAIAVCGQDGRAMYRTERLPSEVGCATGPVTEQNFQIVESPRGLLHVARFPMETAVPSVSHVAIVHDLSFIDRRQTRARDYLIAFAAIGTVGLALMSMFIAWLVLRGWIQQLKREISRGEYRTDSSAKGTNDAVLDEIRTVLREAERAQRMESDFRENWTPEALRHVVQNHVGASQLIVVSNREPYIHQHQGDRIAVQYPASGMVTAIEPIMRACSGIWVAHGSGSADRIVVDQNDRVAVPPNNPSYALQRVWLTEEEEQGYYYGFANEGLWPLCHLAFVRPAFRPADWKHYVAVNERFAESVLRAVNTPRPLILVQDYHFALLPGLLRAKLPDATIAIFWHIPWPNAEAFGICPWKRDILRSMLAADIVGFHTRDHVQNFLASVDDSIEAHVDHVHHTVSRQQQLCHVEAYPISIEWPPRWLDSAPPVADCRARVQREYGLKPDVRIGLGVERWDFTKGIVDRLAAFERFLETSPAWRGKVSVLQIAAPSRSKLPAYQELQRDTHRIAKRINTRFGTPDYKPVILIGEHRDPQQVFELYRACDFCIVNSLHDGMNLVAKEFVAARSDEDGALVLSTFAGASRELREAILVNPFDIDQTAQAFQRALTMSRAERQERMQIMRSTVKQNNVYRWAGHMLMDAARVRQRQRMRAFEREQGPQRLRVETIGGQRVAPR